VRRVLVVGNTGAGKTTMAAALAARLGVPHVEMDALFWEPGWVQSELAVFRARVDEATGGDGWTACGNYSRAVDITWPRADTVVWLDLPVALSVWRVIVRTVRRRIRREQLWGTNHEKISDLFKLNDESLVYFALKHGRRKRAQIAERIAAHPHVTVHHLRSRRDVRRFLAGLS